MAIFLANISAVGNSYTDYSMCDSVLKKWYRSAKAIAGRRTVLKMLAVSSDYKRLWTGSRS